jgi:type IV secretory pathway VirB10-like protein
MMGVFRRSAPPANPLNGQASPQGFRQGRRLSNRGWLIVRVAGAVFFVLIGLSTFNGPKKDAQATSQEDHAGSSYGLADEVSGQRSIGITPKATPLPTATPLPSPFATPVPVAAAAPSPTPDEEKKRLKDAYFAALNARSGVQTQGFQQMLEPRPKAMIPQQVAMLSKLDPNNAHEVVRAYQEDQAPVAPALPAYGPQGGTPGGNVASALAGYNGNANRWALNTTVQQPATPYVIEPGWPIHAALERPINSQLPGGITARVTKDVMDSPSGRFLLIPQGSTLVGEYQNKVEYGQNRVFVAWQLIVFPDGSKMDIGAMPGQDGEGVSGLHDQTDAHFFRLFGHALLMSGITAGFAISQPQYGYGNGNSVNASQALSESLGQNLGNVMSQLFNKDVNVSPTLKIRAAFPLTVYVNKEMVFPAPYHMANYDANN